MTAAPVVPPPPAGAAHSRSWWAAWWTHLLPWVLLVLALTDSTMLWHGHSHPAKPAASTVADGAGGGGQLLPTPLLSARARTLVVYVFASNHPESNNNLRFFVREAIQYLCHPNECYDLGTVGWVLDSQVQLDNHSYFVRLNSSVRGPFLPVYLRGRLHWTEPLLSRLSTDVKLVGATISCGGVWGPSSPDAAPHVQSYLAATDVEGMALLRGSGTVFRCWGDKIKTVLEAEMGASAVMLAAGFNLDCLMLRYQGVDWRDVSAQRLACNAAHNPIYVGWHGGTSLNPLKVLFIKMKQEMLHSGWPQTTAALKYGEWIHAVGEQAARAAAGLPPSSEWLAAIASG